MTDGTESTQQTLWDRLYEEINEIAEVLARQQGKDPRDVWKEALTLHRVRYDTEILPPPDTA